VLLSISVDALVAAQADRPGAARDLLGEVAAVYRKMNSFESTALYTVSSDTGGLQPQRALVVSALYAPAKSGWTGTVSLHDCTKNTGPHSAPDRLVPDHSNLISGQPRNSRKPIRVPATGR